MLTGWITLIPPVMVVVTAMITRHIRLSLIAGFVTALFIAAHGHISTALRIAWETVSKTSLSLDNIYLYLFLILVGTLVSLFSLNKSAYAFARSMTRTIHSTSQAQYASMLTSFLLFIDDYLSILTAGYMMSAITDHVRVSRNKLAFIIHSLAGPVVILAPISTWVAAIITYIDHAGVAIKPIPGTITQIIADPFFIYLQSIPFIIYSFLIIASVWFIIRYNISYGPMHSDEIRAIDFTPPPVDEQTNASASDLLIPLATLIGGVIIGLPLAGGFYFFGESRGFIEAFKHNDHPFLVMFLAALLATIVGILRSLKKGLLSLRSIMNVFRMGGALMHSAIAMVFIASALSYLLTNHVGTGQYLASLLLGSMPAWLLPVTFFAASLLCTTAIGSAWGNLALMIPIAIPMVTTFSASVLPTNPQALPLLFPVLGALFSGSVCGNHISPLSDTTTMTATSTGVSPLEHAYTQFPYSIPAIIGCFVSFLISGICAAAGMQAWITIALSLGTGLLVCFSLLLLFSKKWR